MQVSLTVVGYGMHLAGWAQIFMPVTARVCHRENCCPIFEVPRQSYTVMDGRDEGMAKPLLLEKRKEKELVMESHNKAKLVGIVIAMKVECKEKMEEILSSHDSIMSQKEVNVKYGPMVEQMSETVQKSHEKKSTIHL